MDELNERTINQAAFRRLQGFIGANYPGGRFLAISRGKIIADAGSFDELNAALQGKSCNSSAVLVVQAGADYPDAVTIFTLGQSCSQAAGSYFYAGAAG